MKDIELTKDGHELDIEFGRDISYKAIVEFLAEHYPDWIWVNDPAIKLNK